MGSGSGMRYRAELIIVGKVSCRASSVRPLEGNQGGRMMKMMIEPECGLQGAQAILDMAT